MSAFAAPPGWALPAWAEIGDAADMVPSRIVAALYALFATLALLLLAPAMPPFQNADEPAHAYRADQISHLHLMGKKLADGTSGGLVDTGMPVTATRFNDLPFQLDHKVHHDSYADVAWGPLEDVDFHGTAAYPPFFYIPAAAALAAARALNMPLLHGVQAARMAGGLVSIFIGSLAILLAGDAGIWLFAILTLPMSLCLTAALSQDGPMLAVTALAVAVCRRTWSAPPTPRLLGILASLLSMVAMARPPYAAFALLPATVPAGRRARALAAGTVVLATLVWGAVNVRLVRLPVMQGGVVGVRAQLHHLLAEPWQLPILFANTAHMFGRDMVIGFIGRPGWLDVPLPPNYYRAALVELAMALVTTLAASRLVPKVGAAVIACVTGSVIGIGLLQYLTWSLVGATAIGGLQGRYFLAPAMLLAAFPPAPTPQWSRVPQFLVLGFPIVSIPVTIHAIIARYYF